MKIVIVVRSFPPSTSISARRWGCLATELQALGVELVIITSGSCLKKTDKYMVNGTPVIALPFGEPKTDIVVAKKESCNGKGRGRFSSRMRMAIVDATLVPWIKAYIYSKNKLIPAIRNADLIVSSYGPSGPFWLGWWLSVKLGKPWVADLRDSFESRDLLSNPFSRFLSRFVERVLLRRARMRLTISKKLSDYLSLRYGCRFFPIYNGWSEVDKVAPVSLAAGQKEYFYYAGTIYDHRMDAFCLMVRALQKFRGVCFRLRLINTDLERIRSIISIHDINHVVEILSPAGADVVKQELSSAAAVVVLENLSDMHEWSKGTVTGKLLGLLASGKQGIAVCSSGGEIHRLVDEISGWEFAPSLAACEKAISEILARKFEGVDVSFIDGYSIHAQARLLLRMLDAEFHCGND